MTQRALAGIRVIEFAAFGPAPYGGMLLADLGADVIRIDRPGSGPGDAASVVNRGKRSVAIDLRHPRAAEPLRALIESADVLIEPFRPGVMERLGLSPEVCQRWNPPLVYVRMTGWGQAGPYAQAAGHDLNYIAVTGLLGAIGEPTRAPQIPLNVAGDIGGGGTFLAIGALAGVVQARSTGRGTVVDAAMVDGAASLLAGIHTMLNGGRWADERGANVLDGAAPFYSLYETSDGEHLAVAPIESKFFAEFARIADIDIAAHAQHEREGWADLRDAIASRISEHSLTHWVAAFAGTDGCVAGVESLTSAASNDHVRGRGSIVRDAGGIQPGIVPRLSGHDPSPPPIGSAPLVGAHTREILSELDVDVEALLGAGVVEHSLPREEVAR
jgi:alpha-methylacyl-CoA racemase